MNNRMESRNQAQYNVEIHRPKGMGGWRTLYLKFIHQLKPRFIVELGSGAPDFLRAVECERKVAIDAGNTWEAEFRKVGAEFVELDLDHDELPSLGSFDVAVCSDVLEHLLFPDRTLGYLHRLVGESGVLFSHVPNEFSLAKTAKIMLGLSESLYFHRHCEEYNDPHLHRFTRIGFEKFLSRYFKYNLFISDIRFNIAVRLLRFAGVPIPYALQGGPTFISTNNREKFATLRDIKERLFLRSFFTRT
jgi:SAM-dependent methyltransferase